jgi:hypothetical protein
MGELTIVLVVVGVLVLGGLGAWFAWLAEQKRMQALEALARRRGWRFWPGEDASHSHEYAHFEIFRRGHSRVARNTLTGAIDTGRGEWAFKAGDFRYKVTSGSGKSRRTSTYHFSYLIVHLPWTTPPLLIRPEGVFDKLLGALGFDDIDFESEEFSRRFHVAGPDKRFAYDVCHPRAIELLLQARAPLLDLENGRCCLSDGARRWEPDQFELWVAFAQRFFALWPEHLAVELQRQQGSRRPDELQRAPGPQEG